MTTSTNYALTEDEKNEISFRLSHYVAESLYHNEMKGIDSAKLLGMNSTEFAKFKAESEINTIMASVESLIKLAKLKNIDVVDFFSRIIGREVKKTKMIKYTWIEKIYKSLEVASIMGRKNFADTLEKSPYERLELMLRLVVAIDDKNFEELENLVKNEEFEKKEKKDER